MKVIKKAQLVVTVRYVLRFELLDTPGAGYSFDCDEYGAVIWDKDTGLVGKENLRKCIDGTHNVGKPHIEKLKNRYWDPTVIECYCGKEVICYGFTNTCDCGKDYSSSGVLLAPREQWGEETGEHIADILNIQ